MGMNFSANLVKKRWVLCSDQKKLINDFTKTSNQRSMVGAGKTLFSDCCQYDFFPHYMDELVTTAQIVPSLWKRLVTSMFAMVVLHCVRHCIALIALIAQNLSSWETQPSQANYFLYTMLHTMRCHEQWFNHSILLHIVCIPIERVHDTCIIDISLAKTRAATKYWL